MRDQNSGLRMLLRAEVMRQAVEQGLSTYEAIDMLSKLHTAGTLWREAEALDGMLEGIVRQAIQNHAGAMVMVERAKAQAQAEARAEAHAVNPPLVLTAGGTAIN